MITLLSNVEKLLPVERNLFLWLNSHHTPFMDVLMSVYTNKLTWIPLALVLLFVLVYKVEWKYILLFLLCALMIGFLCDMFAAEIIKPFFARLRPSHHPDFKELVHLVDGRRGGRFGFISNHAANGCGIAIFTALLFRWKYYTITIFAWVLITMYSRIYLGVHFLTDIIGGCIWGLFVGTLTYYFFFYARKLFFANEINAINSTPVLSRGKALAVIYCFLATLVCILIYAFIVTI